MQAVQFSHTFLYSLPTIIRLSLSIATTYDVITMTVEEVPGTTLVVGQE